MPISRPAARLAFAAAAAFVVLLAALHVLKPELDPSWRFVSEYAIGRHGWVMTVAFAALGLGHVALFVAVRSQLTTIGGRIGLVLLLVSAAGLFIAAAFPMDPLMTAGEAGTRSGALHNLGGTLGIAGPFAAVLISLKLAANPAWAPARGPLLWAAMVAVAGFLVSAGSIGFLVSRSGGTFGPEVQVGWPNRIGVLGATAWLLMVAWQVNRKGGEASRDG
jgi:hypothetical protein